MEARQASVAAESQRAVRSGPRTADGAERWMASAQSRANAQVAAEVEASNIYRLLATESLGPSRLDGLEERIAKLPRGIREEVLGAYWKERAVSADYRSQRDNEIRPDGACNVTSLAMTFDHLGIKIPGLRDGQQPEDRLSELLNEELGYSLTGSDHPGSFFEPRRELANLLGAELTQDWKSGMSARGCKSYFLETVLPLLKMGAAASIGIRFTNRRGETRYHIVRLEWVDETGITVDDPYGNATFYGGTTMGLSQNSTDVGDADGSEGRKGEDSHWTFSEAAQVVRYVQWTTIPESKVHAAMLDSL